MMKILIHHGKHGNEYWNASTNSLRQGAYRALFEQLGEAGYYEGSCWTHKEELLFNAAMNGSSEACIAFMQLRSGAQYESIEEVEVQERELRCIRLRGRRTSS